MKMFATSYVTGLLACAVFSGMIGTALAAQRAANYEQASALAPKDGYIAFAYAEGWDKFSKELCMKLMGSQAISQAAGNSVLMPMPVYECPTKEQMEALKTKMGKLGVKEAESYPAIFMFDASGRHYATLCGPDIMRATQEELAARIARHMTAMRKQNQLLESAEAAKGLEKAKLLGAAAQVKDAIAPADIVKQIKAVDPKDESGFVRSLELKPWNYTEDLLKRKLDDATLKKLEGRPDKAVRQRRLELEMILKELDAKLADPAYTDEQKQVFCSNAIGTLHRKGDVTDVDRIRKYAKMMADFGPNTTLGKSAPIVVKAWASELTLDGGWKPSNLPMDDTPVELQGKLPISSPGTYAVTFTYRSGAHALKVKEVRLFDGKNQVAADAHPGSTGTPQNTKGNTYRLKVDKAVADPHVFIIFDMPEKRHSFGTISITRE